ncbi:putative two-component membrane permease complex subunit [Anaerotignum neopropionicum]|uniref:Putative two-component membrane permease complex subunit n=1 Tax=Anaerotignum neopropionicum TaxID=36847 RepID=A0A136WEU7_9FIRM|nr:permease [Anaerotignum neopropionicum]KXL53001.1 putative two-component membrane permease complex subunit [Anaerotignum neopropionicum]
MKTRVDIVTGFLDSGKTTYVNTLLQIQAQSAEKIVVVQFEAGEVNIDYGVQKENMVFVNALEGEAPLDAPYLVSIIEKYSPDKIIIEYNGMYDVQEVFTLFEQNGVRGKCVLGNIICLVDATTFEVYMNNLGEILKNQIATADRIILNKVTHGQEETLKSVEKRMRALNKKAELFTVELFDDEISQAVETDFEVAANIEAAPKGRLSNISFGIFLLFALTYLALSVVRGLNASEIRLDFSGFEGFYMVFLSILMQTFPFMLIGVFVSSGIQVFFSNEAIVKLFPKKFGLGFLTAMFGGLFLPVCECAIVPVMTGLVKKGVALPIAVTFMLAAPIINPIVIISTYYAFPGHPEFVIFRVYFGLVIALVVGILLMIFPETKVALLEQANSLTCDCVYCTIERNEKKGLREKLRLLFLHAGEDFFNAGKYLVIGAFLTSLIQVMVPKNIFLELGTKDGLSLIVMMATAFLFSVCSTSDAFIARSFWNSFSAGSIMGFLVFGPMMDIKNLFMLLGSFRKTFVVKLVLLITCVAFLLLYFLTFIII